LPYYFCILIYYLKERGENYAIGKVSSSEKKRGEEEKTNAERTDRQNFAGRYK